MIARGLAQAGARVLIASRDQAELGAAAERLSEFGEVELSPADVSSSEGAAALAQAARERFDKLNILVNNAGTSWHAPLEEFPASGWDDVMHTNVEGMFHLTVGLLPALRAARERRGPGTSDQHRLGRRHPAGPAEGQLQLYRQQGGGAHAHPAPGQAARPRADHGQCDRPGPVPEQADGTRPRRSGHAPGRRAVGASGSARVGPTMRPDWRCSSPRGQGPISRER